MKSEKPFRVAGQFLLDKQIGEGCFGQVFLGHDESSGEQVAIKVEDRNSQGVGSLRSERDMLELLNQPVAMQGFVQMYYYGKFKHTGTCLVMELLGKSLEQCVEECGGTFNALTTALLADQVLQRTEFLHSKGILHRDIKPENFMMGIGDKANHVYMIDFGLSDRYWKGARHLPCREGESFAGTARYASINAHRGLTQSRRDDLEAIGHMLAFFLRGKLPWSGFKVRDEKERNKMIERKKASFDLDSLFQGFHCGFKEYLLYCRNLKYSERPDYERVRHIFTSMRTQLADGEPHGLQWLGDVPEESLVPLRPWPGCLQPDDANNEASCEGQYSCWRLASRRRNSRRSRGQRNSAFFTAQPQNMVNYGVAARQMMDTE